MKTLEEMEKELELMKQCFEHCDNQRSEQGQREAAAIRELEIEIRTLRERGGVHTFGLEK